jgi:phosphoserine phosphatase
VRTGIISSGPLLLAERAKRELGFDEVRTNRLGMREGKLTGKFRIDVPDHDKLSAGLKVLEDWGITPAQTMYVGDGENDVELARTVGLAIAYNADCEALKRAADHYVAQNQLRNLIGALEPHLPEPANADDSGAHHLR